MKIEVFWKNNLRDLQARHSSGCLNGNARPLSMAAILISTNVFFCVDDDDDRLDAAAAAEAAVAAFAWLLGVEFVGELVADDEMLSAEAGEVSVIAAASDDVLITSLDKSRLLSEALDR